jgi:hypothetical protein
MSFRPDGRHAPVMRGLVPRIPVSTGAATNRSIANACDGGDARDKPVHDGLLLFAGHDGGEA